MLIDPTRVCLKILHQGKHNSQKQQDIELGYELLEDSYEELGYEIMMINFSKEKINKIWLQLPWINFQNASKGNKLINASYQLWHIEVA